MDFQPCLLVCTCVSANLFMPVDEWEFMCLPCLLLLCTHVFGPLTAIFIHAAISPAPCVSFKVQAVMREPLWKRGSFIPLGILCPNHAARGASFDSLLKLLSRLQGRIPGSRAVQLQGGIEGTEAGGPLQHVSQEALIPSTGRKTHISVTLCCCLLL